MNTGSMDTADRNSSSGSSKDLLWALGVLVLALIIGGFWYWTSRNGVETVIERGVVDEIEEKSLGGELFEASQNPAADIPETNPFNTETNPFSRYVNPFDR